MGDARHPQALDDGRAGPKVLVFSGKGGVGKTTVAAATGLRCARRGLRTIVVSVDIAHSLADAFDVTEELEAHPRGAPLQVAENLEIQEIDVHEEIKHHWDDVHAYFAFLFAETGLEDVLAEELAVIPGMEEVIALLYLNQYVQDDDHDVVVLDLAPTAESLRFISMPNTMDWYMRHVFQFEKGIAKIARPIARRLADLPLPEEKYFDAIEDLWARLEGIDKVLLDPDRCRVRLVTNAEKIVVKETRRAFLYFALYGITIDAIVVNRVLTRLPEGETLPPSLEGWLRTHQEAIQQIEKGFDPLPVTVVPMQPDEVVGLGRLDAFGDDLFGDVADGIDPTAFDETEPPFKVEEEADATAYAVRMPGAEKHQVDLWVEESELIIRFGQQKRHVPLPRALRGRRPDHAGFEAGWLRIRFEKPGRGTKDQSIKPPAQRARKETPI